MPGHAQQLFGLKGRGSVHNGVLRAAPLAALNPAATMDLAISLPVHNQTQLDETLSELSNPNSSMYRHYLSGDEFNARFGPTQADYDTVIAYLQAHGFTVTRTYANRMLVDVSGPVASVQEAFHVRMNTYRHPTENRNFFGPDREPTVDRNVPILDVNGLDNYVLPHPKALIAPSVTAVKSKGGSGPGGQYVGNDFRTAYAPQITLDGTGQTVALFQFGSYFPNDITAYCNQAGLPAAQITVVALNGVSGSPNPGDNTLEQSLDIEMVHSMAPAAKIRFYTGNSAADIWNQIAVDNIAKSVSSSWSVSPPPSTLNQILQQMAAQGQSAFNASGDSGYSASPFGWDDNPYMTSVGGTDLSTSTPGGPWTYEDGWSGSSGYISPNFGIPTWQQGINMTACGGSTTQRNCPDVAMVATNIWATYNNGGSSGVLGTSAASPLWAAYMALVNQQAASLGKPTAGFINPAVYAIGKGSTYQGVFHDITAGNNGKPAVAGYDLVTGWGSPASTSLLATLSATPGVGYVFAANENQSGTFNTPVDLAYGANSSYLYKYAQSGAVTFSNTWFGGDPAFGIGKSGYYKGFTLCAGENGSFTFTAPVEAAYGANGKYNYNRGVSGTVTFNNATFGDPNVGVGKSGYYMPYALCCGEGGIVNFPTAVDLAYGANGHYVFRHAVTGAVTFNNATFGDPISGVNKSGYYRPSH